MKRRQFLGTTAAASALAVAGCSGSGDDSDGGGDHDSPEAVTEAFLTTGDPDEAEQYLHPESGLEMSPQRAEFADQIEFVEAEIISEEVTTDILEENSLGLNSVTESVLTDVSDGEDVALVEATLTGSGEGGQGEFTQPEITATDGGDWYILDQPTQVAGF